MPKKKKEPKEWVCYCLQSKKKYTYVGMTNDFKRRHRQHNGALVGGAKFTRRYRPWSTLFKIRGLSCKKHVLQLEWAMKHRRKKGYCGLKGRVRTLEYLLSLPRWTKKAPKLCDLKLRIEFKISKQDYMKLAGLKEWVKRKGITFIFSA